MKKDSEFYFFMESGAELAEDLSDGAWWAFLEDHVKFWNKDHGTNYDPTDMVHRFLELRNDRVEGEPTE